MSTIFDSMGIDSAIIIIVLLVIVVILIGFMISNGMRLTRLERKYKMFMKGSDAQSLEKTFVRKFAQIDRLYEAKDQHDHELLFIKKNLDKMFSKYGVEKYDAFDDVGGKLSFALALLDKDNTGLILNAVHSRDNCFLYLKEIVKGESYVMLSQEEVEALTAEHAEAPHLRVLQKRLAKDVTVMVHSEEVFNAAVEASGFLFGNATSEALKKLDEDTLLAVFEGVPQFEVSKDVLAEGVKAVDLFVDNAAVFASKGEMRKLVQGGGVSLNKEKLNAFDQVITTADLLDGKYLLVQRGKKNYNLVIAK